jgi:hypothetical protein
MATDTGSLTTFYLAVVRVIIVSIKGALIYAHLTLDAVLLVSFNNKLGW